MIKKLELEERQVINNKLQACIVFDLIKYVICKFDLENMTRYLCRIAGVSTSGYYRHKSKIDIRSIREEEDLKSKEHRVVTNKLNREFKQYIPGKVLLTDITYMPYGNSKMAYLSTIKDSSTNEILSYHLSKSLHIDIVT